MAGKRDAGRTRGQLSFEELLANNQPLPAAQEPEQNGDGPTQPHRDRTEDADLGRTAVPLCGGSSNAPKPPGDSDIQNSGSGLDESGSRSAPSNRDASGCRIGDVRVRIRSCQAPGGAARAGFRLNRLRRHTAMGIVVNGVRPVAHPDEPARLPRLVRVGMRSTRGGQSRARGEDARRPRPRYVAVPSVARIAGGDDGSHVTEAGVSVDLRTNPGLEEDDDVRPAELEVAELLSLGSRPTCDGGEDH